VLRILQALGITFTPNRQAIALAPRAKPRDRRAKFAKFWQIVHTTGPCALLTLSTAPPWTAPHLADARADLSDRSTVDRLLGRAS
jgi:hypothetical protein